MTNENFEHPKKSVKLRITNIKQHRSNFDLEEDLTEIEQVWQYSPKDDIVICPVCNNEHYLGSYRQFASNYCPNCGSKMQPIN